MKIDVFSEIGTLQKVLVHRPGKEVERIYASNLKKLLFDDVLYLKKAQTEHDQFVHILEKENCQVYYIEKLVTEVLDFHPTIRNEFIEHYLAQSFVKNESILQAARCFLHNIKDNGELVNQTIAGITKRELHVDFHNDLIDHMAESDVDPLYIDPMPNLLFMRDPLISIFNHIKINKMWSKVRQREAIYIQFLTNYHPDFQNILTWEDTPLEHMEGGDVLIINKHIILIGISQRTNACAIKIMTEKLFAYYADLQTVIAIKLPKERATMHLDTVLTQLDYDKFLIDRNLAHLTYVYFEMTRHSFVRKQNQLENILQSILQKKITFYIVGNNYSEYSQREQWDCGSNSLTIRPGTIVVYDRNYITNAMLKSHDINVIEISSSELVRGRGGPRCMTMPLARIGLK